MNGNNLIELSTTDLASVDGGFVCGGLCIGIAFTAGFALGATLLALN